MKDNTRNIDNPIQIERGADPSVLLIAFSGFAQRLMLTAHDFLAVANLLDYSRILLKDVTKTCFYAGLPPLAENYTELLELLKESIAKLAPEKVMCIGTSGGGTAALLFGHTLKADYVHAFSPYTYLDEKNLARYQDEELLTLRKDTRETMWALPVPGRIFDLQQVLNDPNGNSHYFIHICRGSKRDAVRAAHIGQCPGVDIFTYACTDHGSAKHLARKKLLSKYLKIENQDMLVTRAQKIKRRRKH